MKHAFSIGLIAIVILFDQISKFFVLSGSIDPIQITGFLNIVNVWNDGIAFGLFSGLNSNLFFIFVTGIIALGFSYLLLKSSHKTMTIIYSLIVGGAIGNLIDRLRYNAVFDFIDFHVAGLHWPAFNIADSAICIGGAMFIWHFISSKNIGISKKNTGIKKKHRSLAFITLFAAALAVFSINGCTKKTFGLNKAMPDESNFSKRPDLSIPPNFNLPAPQDEDPAMQEKSVPKKVVVKKQAASEDLTASDEKFMEKFGTDKE